ncbi:MAG: hypothetical protein J6125_03085 [Clostridia bacterium]|nr:hypothetical protein [Clostridia bacterium]
MFVSIPAVTHTANVDFGAFRPVWLFVMQMALLLITLLVANVLRRRIPFLRKMLFPTALVGGLMLFVVKTVLQVCGVGVGVLIDNATMQIITYHMLGLGFVAMALKRPRQTEKASAGKLFHYALINGSNYMLQSWVGLLITLVFFGGIFFAGALLPCGFAQGTGNGLTWGDNYTDYGLTGGAGFGLTIATVGFIVASVVGVVYMNVMRRRGKLTVRPSVHADPENKAQNGTAPESISVDKFSMNLGLILLTYAVAFGLMFALSRLGGFFVSLAWGLSFMWALLCGIGVRALLDLGEKKNVIRETYRSNYLMDRFGGFCFDLMVLAGVAAIEWEDVALWWLPLTVLCAAGGVVTFFQCRLAAKHCFPGYEHETFLVNFGTLTGTINNGMILLREIDPDFSTPAAHFAVEANVFCFLLDAPLFLTLAMIPRSRATAWVLCGMFFVLWAVYTLLIFYRRLLRKKYRPEDDQVWTDDRGFVRRAELNAPASGAARDGADARPASDPGETQTPENEG